MSRGDKITVDKTGITWYNMRTVLILEVHYGTINI